MLGLEWGKEERRIWALNYTYKWFMGADDKGAGARRGGPLMYETIYGVPYAYELERPMHLAVHVYPRIARRTRLDAPGRAEGQGNGKSDSPDKTGRTTRNGNPIHQQPKRRKA